MIYVEGKIAYSKRTGDDGIERYFTDIKIRDFTLLGGKREEGTARPGAQRREPSAAPAKTNFDDVPFDDDIPFD
jgi:single-strand DNA-binding protein